MNDTKLTQEDLRRWLFDHYKDHVTDGMIEIDSLELALAKNFRGKPNHLLHEFVFDFCLDLQEAALRQLDK